ncbi:OmpA family protein [Inhella gelatinilytica]|uniref:OmpA family protein n=1 Tax=Inhella gelatinilytica TaxID=2795030 RepID=A0A931NA18_9BURK|nr:OmpA family protein [Inhella gelatinilytica]MBH9551988.1 OmpA family protein [Inhella gelatinilytica]
MKAVGILVLGTLALTGCATKDYVNESVAPVRSDVQGLNQRVQAQGEGLKSLDGRVSGQEERIKALQLEAQARALEAGKIRAPGFLMSTVLTDDRFKFKLGHAQLSAEAAAVLDELVAKLKADNQPVVLEIQGHTDSTGSADANQRLGLARAEMVRQHLARAGVPLHRMATISYGESAPMADNATAQGRSQNRRVQVVVMR